MTANEMLEAVNEYQTTDSISRKNTLFDLIRQKSWEVWYQGYQYACNLYKECPLPAVEEILEDWGPVSKNISNKVEGYTYYTQINTMYVRYDRDHEIKLSGLTNEGVKIGLPASIIVKVKMFDPDYLDYRIRKIKACLHYKLSHEVYNKRLELEKLQDAYKRTTNPILSKLKTAESGTTLWYERWCEGQMREAKTVKFVGIDKSTIIVEIDGIRVTFNPNGTQTSEDDYTDDCMLFPSSDHKRWEDVTYVPSSKQKVLYGKSTEKNNL